MSSLMQFDGRTGRRGVELEFSRGLAFADGHFTPREPVPCAACGRDHPQVYVAWRKPKGMFGCWVVFEFNGEEHVPDLSLLIDVVKLPRGSRKLSAEENSALWHRS